MEDSSEGRPPAERTSLAASREILILASLESVDVEGFE